MSFGLVTIPVEVHTAVRDRGLKFHLLRKADHSRIKYQKIAERDGTPVEWQNLVKGYEYSKGHFIVLTPEDFASAALERDRTITIMDFVSAADVDDRYFEKPYYLTPGKGGQHAYAVLRECIRDTGLIGIAKFVLRDKQHLAAVEVIKDALVLYVLRFCDELVNVNDLNFPASDAVKKQELETARMLVNAFKTTWEPRKYTDEYQANLLRIIESKKRGAAPDLEDPQATERGDVVDLMERLRRSLEGAGGRDGQAEARRPATGRRSRASTSKSSATRATGSKKAAGKKRTSRKAA
jgi:DNA end-binding protein Ku